jgi:hypothetical protein
LRETGRIDLASKWESIKRRKKGGQRVDESKEKLKSNIGTQQAASLRTREEMHRPGKSHLFKESQTLDANADITLPLKQDIPRKQNLSSEEIALDSSPETTTTTSKNPSSPSAKTTESEPPFNSIHKLEKDPHKLLGKTQEPLYNFQPPITVYEIPHGKAGRATTATITFLLITTAIFTLSCLSMLDFTSAHLLNANAEKWITLMQLVSLTFCFGCFVALFKTRTGWIRKMKLFLRKETRETPWQNTQSLASRVRSRKGKVQEEFTPDGLLEIETAGFLPWTTAQKHYDLKVVRSARLITDARHRYEEEYDMELDGLLQGNTKEHHRQQKLNAWKQFTREIRDVVMRGRTVSLIASSGVMERLLGQRSKRYRMDMQGFLGYENEKCKCLAAVG